MAQTKFGELVVNTSGDLPSLGSVAPSFTLTGNDLKDVNSDAFAGKKIVLNIFPSIETRVCSTSVREFNKRIVSFPDTVVLCISRDLPLAMKRFCGAEGIDRAITLSDFRYGDFGKKYGVDLMDGSFKGLLARAVMVIDTSGKIIYTELVPAIGQEPDYEAALKVLG